MKSKTGVAYLYLLVAFFCWGSLYVVNKFAMQSLPAPVVTGARAGIAAVTLLFMARKIPRTPIAREDRLPFILLGGLGYYFTVLMTSVGTQLAGASMASLVNSLTPVCITIIAALLLKERITPVRIVCLLLAISGTYIVTTNAASKGQALGVLLVLLGVISWGYASTLMRRLTQKYHPLLVTLYGMVIGLALHIPTAVVSALLAPAGGMRLTWQAVVAILYMGVVATGLAQSMWSRSLSLLEAGTCSLFYPLQPFFSVILGMAFLGERPGVRFYIGSLLIAADVVINCLYNRKLERERIAKA